jgi:hypothetical protein
MITMEKNHMKDFKMTRNGIKSKIVTIERLWTKMKRQPSRCVLTQIEKNNCDLYTQYKVLEEQERQSVKKINVVERTQFCAIAACLQDIIMLEVNAAEEFCRIGDDLEIMNKIISNPNDLPNTADDLIKDIIANETDILDKSSSRQFWGSRCGSFRSLSSLVNSRSNSPLCITENDDPRTKNNAESKQILHEQVICFILVRLL